MLLWLLEHWRTILAAVTFLLSYPFYRITKRVIRLSRTALALEVCQEDLRITTDRMNRQKAHLDAYGIDSSSLSRDHQTSSSPKIEPGSTKPPMN